jgi:K+-sensing histidine kinase KdpD
MSLLVSATDRGSGTPAEVLRRVFDTVVRAPFPTESGCGLGRTITKDFAGARGGTVSVFDRLRRGGMLTWILPQVQRPMQTEPGR